MAKKKIKVAKKRETKIEKQANPWILHGIAIAAFLLVSIAYFAPQLQGKVIRQGDIDAFKAASKEIRDYNDTHTDQALWTNSMFGGMPAYQISMPTSGNKIKFVEKVFNLFLGRPIGYFIAMMIGFYIMCITFGMRPLVALVGSIAFGLTVNHFVLFEAGHTSKLRAFAFFGIIVSGIVNAYRGKYMLGGLLFALGMALEIGVNHIQMPYYLFISLLIYLGILLYRDIRGGKVLHFAKASGVLLVALMLAALSNTTNLWTTYEYAQETMRGKPILTKEVADVTSSSDVDGLAWTYAMRWSNGPLDLFTYLIPRVVGGSSGERISNDSEFARIIGQVSAQEVRSPLYWGSLPSTSGPSYLGAAILLLFVLGSIVVKGDLKWWLLSATILTMLLSLGKNLEFFNRLFFDYFPMFNKFRTPNSIVSVTEFLMILMATLTLSELVDGKIKKETWKKGLIYAGGITGGLCLIFALFGSMFLSFKGLNDNYDPRIVDALISDRRSLMRMDALRSFVFIAVACGLIYYYLQAKLNARWLVVALVILVTIDIWGVGRRYLNNESFIRPNQAEAALAPRQVDQLISKDNDPYFRVFDLSVDPFNSALPAAHHKLIGGYHAAKLQRYQDLIDTYISKGHDPVLNMLNMKYLVQQNGELQVNTNALGNAWYVQRLLQVPDANAEIESLSNFDPQTVAIYHEEFSDYIGEFQPSNNGSITLTEYSPNRLTYESTGTGERFAVFSEIWYGPDKGWKAYIDDEEVPFIRVNYALRGMRIPAGAHTIKFEFAPRSYFVGEKVSTIASIILLIGLLLFIFHQFRPLNSLINSKTQPVS